MNDASQETNSATFDMCSRRLHVVAAQLIYLLMKASLLAAEASRQSTEQASLKFLDECGELMWRAVLESGRLSEMAGEVLQAAPAGETVSLSWCKNGLEALIQSMAHTFLVPNQDVASAAADDYESEGIRGMAMRYGALIAEAVRHSSKLNGATHQLITGPQPLGTTGLLRRTSSGLCWQQHYMLAISALQDLFVASMTGMAIMMEYELCRASDPTDLVPSLVPETVESA